MHRVAGVRRVQPVEAEEAAAVLQRGVVALVVDRERLTRRPRRFGRLERSRDVDQRGAGRRRRAGDRLIVGRVELLDRQRRPIAQKLARTGRVRGRHQLRHGLLLQNRGDRLEQHREQEVAVGPESGLSDLGLRVLVRGLLGGRDLRLHLRVLRGDRRRYAELLRRRVDDGGLQERVEVLLVRRLGRRLHREEQRAAQHVDQIGDRDLRAAALQLTG